MGIKGVDNIRVDVSDNPAFQKWVTMPVTKYLEMIAEKARKEKLYYQMVIENKQYPKERGG